jgi:hypothetical protein
VAAFLEAFVKFFMKNMEEIRNKKGQKPRKMAVFSLKLTTLGSDPINFL